LLVCILPCLPTSLCFILYILSTYEKQKAGQMGLELLAPVEFWVEYRNPLYHFEWNPYGETQ